MLTEATIAIKPSERKKLEEYIRNLSGLISNLFKTFDGMIPANQLCQELNEFSKQGMVLPELSIKFDFNPKGNNGEYHPEWKSIVLNLYRMVKAGYMGPDEFAVKSVDYTFLISILIHEFRHYKRDMKVRSKQYGRIMLPIPHELGSPTYFKDPDEQQAWAGQYIEYIKRHLNLQTPEEILSVLRKVGLDINPQLKRLKNTDHASWRAIMKNAVRIARH